MRTRNSKRHVARCCPETQENWDAVKPTLYDYIYCMQPGIQRSVLATRFGYPLGTALSIQDTAQTLGIAVGKVRSLVFSELGNVRFQKDQAAVDILLEDESLLIVNKPPRIRVSPQNRYSGGSLLSRVVGYLAKAHEHASRVQPAHRLDTDTSGVMVFAKNAETRTYFCRQFASQLIHKKYIAVCQGVFKKSHNFVGELKPGTRFTIDAPIDMSPDFDFYLHEHVISDKGKCAVTQIEVLDVKDFSKADGSVTVLVRASPLTGRTHQIRVHLAHVGLPILYDKVYGLGGIARTAFGKSHTTSPCNKVSEQSSIPLSASALSHEHRLCLHAESLEFCHPITQKITIVNAPLPEDFLSTLSHYSLKD